MFEYLEKWPLGGLSTHVKPWSADTEVIYVASYIRRVGLYERCTYVYVCLVFLYIAPFCKPRKSVTCGYIFIDLSIDSFWHIVDAFNCRDTATALFIRLKPEIAEQSSKKNLISSAEK